MPLTHGHSVKTSVSRTPDITNSTVKKTTDFSPVSSLILRYKDGAGNTTEENSIVFSLIRMR